MMVSHMMSHTSPPAANGSGGTSVVYQVLIAVVKDEFI